MSSSPPARPSHIPDAQSPAGHVRFEAAREEHRDISAKDKAIEFNIQHARELSASPAAAAAQPHAASPSAADAAAAAAAFSPPKPTRSISGSSDEDSVAPSPFAALTSLLQSNSAYHIEYRGYLSNHLPHALISLFHLGASARRLLAFSADYSRKLVPAREEEGEKVEVPVSMKETQLYDSGGRAQGERLADSSQSGGATRVEKRDVVIDRANWQQFLGQKKHYVAYLRFFTAELQRRQEEAEKQPQPASADPLQRQHGSASVLAHSSLSVPQQAAVRSLVAAYFPSLIPGASHSALHPLIHTGWGLCGGSAGLATVCEGLAYCCFAFHSLDGDSSCYASLSSIPAASSLSLLQLLKKTADAFSPLLPAMTAAVQRIPYVEMAIGGFQRRLVYLSIVHPQRLTALDAQLQLPASCPSSAVLSSFFTQLLLLFAVSGNNFFMLHTVTALFALSHILPLLPDSDAVVALRYGVKYIAATWIAEELPGLQDSALQAAISSGSLEQAVDALLQRPVPAGRRGWSELGWDELRSAAVESDDEHTQKLLYLCYDRAHAEHCTDRESRLCRLVAWKRLTDEDTQLFSK